jgi:hypothetical protein
MSKINDGGPAFPRPSDPCPCIGDTGHSGMSLRDWFAGQALAGMIAPMIAADPVAIQRAADTDGFVGRFPDYVANRAYEQADAMLAARSKSGGE